MISLQDFLTQNNITEMQGHSQESDEQTNSLYQLSNSENIKNILEIGFNAGHSSETFLKSNSNSRIISIDINESNELKHGKQYIEMYFPNRHKLLIGNSINIVPELSSNYPDLKFDLIFIDGGHDYETAKADIINCKKLSHPNTTVIVDDVSNYLDELTTWAVEPTKVWNEMVESKFIKQAGSEDYAYGRGMRWGYYNFE